MKWYGIAVLIAGGCGFNVGASGVDDARTDVGHIDPDAMEPDAPDAPAACSLWHPQHVMPCMLGAPKPALVITQSASPWTYNTTNQGGTLSDSTGVVLMSTLVVTQADSSLIAVLNVESLTVQTGATLLVTGDKPLVIASWDTISLNGRIDAGSVTTEINNTGNAHIDGPSRIGAGANAPGKCTGMIGASGANAQMGGGSGGGGGGGLRGNGGKGSVGDTVMVAGGSGGARLVAAPAVIRGGCNGGPSGSAATSTGLLPPATAASVSVGGAGGGAVELAAKTSITISSTGSINAGGGGGAGAPHGSAVGGGGGGSGGYIGLDAPVITITAGKLSANGGGGGGSAPFAGNGNQGSNAESVEPAAGGAVFGGGNCGLAGAPGSSGTTFDAADAMGTDSCGGGGGGGGAGFIFIVSPSLMSTSSAISPPQLP